MKHKRTPSFGIILSLFTVIFFVGVVPGFINIAFGQEEREVRFLFNSENVGDEFDIYVQLPEGFEGKRGSIKHVIYLLDANWYFDGTHMRLRGGGLEGIVSSLQQQDLMEDALLVGISELDTGNNVTNNRGRDFLQNHEEFYRFLVDELIPHIDEEYGTDNLSASTRTLIGHSDGGYFTFYAFVKNDHMGAKIFDNFISLSPSFYKDYYLPYEEEADLYLRTAPHHILPDLMLYIATGGLDEQKFVDHLHMMTERLDERMYPGLRFKGELYPDDYHSSLLYNAIRNGLILAFEDTFKINPGLNGSWANFATLGQGFFVDVLPNIPLIFLAWFTYDVAQTESAQAANDGSPITKPNAQVGDDNHRWVTAQGAFAGDTAVLDVTLTTGGVFDDPQAVTNSEAGEQGTITLKFTDCKTATIDYDFTVAGLTGSVPIQRLADDNVDLCVALKEQ